MSADNRQQVSQLTGSAKPGYRSGFRSLQVRFVIYALAIMLLVAALVSLLIFNFAGSSFESHYQKHLSQKLSEYNEELRIVILSRRDEELKGLLKRIASRVDAVSIRMFDSKGKARASYLDETRERGVPSISYQQHLEIADRAGNIENWSIRLRVKPGALSILSEWFILQQMIIILFMVAGGMVGMAFAFEMTVGRQFKALALALSQDRPEICTLPEFTGNDEFAKICNRVLQLSQAFHEEQEKLKSFVRAAGMVCFKVDPDDETVELSGDIGQLFGIAQEQIKTVYDLIDKLQPEHQAILRQSWQNLRMELLTGKNNSGHRQSVWQLNRGLSAEEGVYDSAVWIRVSTTWQASNGIPVIYGAIMDATDLKQSENSARAELENYRSIYANLPVGLWRSYNDRFVNMNQAMAQILGYSSPREAIEKVQSIGHQLYITPVDRSFFFDELRKREQLRSLEMRFRRADGELFWAAVYGRIFYENGREYCEGCFIDITEKRRAEEKLRQNEEILRQSIESGNIVAWQFEPVAEHFMLFGSFKKLLGESTSAEVSYKAFCKLVHSEDLQFFNAYFDKARRADPLKGLCVLDFRICRVNPEKKTDVRYLRILSSVAESLFSGSKRVMRGVLVDTTDLMSLVKAQKDEYASFEGMNTSELFTSMSHEIRTPLNAIIGYSELLVPLAESEKVKHYAASVIAAGRSLSNIINSINDLVRLESGRVELIEGPLNISDLVGELESMFSEEAERKGLEFWIQVDSELPPVILADEARIREILINLVSNAIKFTNQGSVGVHFALGHSTQLNQINLLITVEDTGIGIDCENPELIFDPMYRRKFQSRFGGTGLGLAICRRLIELLNGTIKVKTELHRGSRFDVILREVKVPERAKKAGAGTDSKGNLKFDGQKIMVADDTASNRELIAEAMKNAGLNVICASDGNEAVELAKKELPELIFMDLRMPQKDGVLAARELRCEKELASTPIIAVTATNSFAELEELKGLFDGFIIKPVSLIRLFAEAGRFLSHVASNESAKETEIKLPPEAFEQLSNPWKLCEIVSKEFLDKFARIDSAIVIDQMQEVAERLRHLAVEHSFNSLALEAEILLSNLQSYDIVAIRKSQTRIKTIMGQLLKVYSRR